MDVVFEGEGEMLSAGVVPLLGGRAHYAKAACERLVGDLRAAKDRALIRPSSRYIGPPPPQEVPEVRI